EEALPITTKALREWILNNSSEFKLAREAMEAEIQMEEYREITTTVLNLDQIFIQKSRNNPEILRILDHTEELRDDILLAKEKLEGLFEHNAKELASHAKKNPFKRDRSGKFDEKK